MDPTPCERCGIIANHLTEAECIQELKLEIEDLVKADGWASVEERDVVVRGEEEPHVLIDCRTIVGNTPLFWMPEGKGYGSVISEIGRFAKADAYGHRDTDFPVPLKLAVECARPRVDIQLLNRVLDREGLPVPSMGWGDPPRCVDCEKKANMRPKRGRRT